MFNADFYINNRKQLKKICGDKPIIIAGNGLMQRSGDTNFNFRQDSNLLYLTGITEPNICLYINPKTNEEFIIIEKKSGTARIFDGDFDKKAFSATSGIAKVIDITEAFSLMLGNQKTQPIMFNSPKTSHKLDFTYNCFKQKISRRLQARSFVMEDVHPQLASLRAIKQTPEIAAIKQAVSITKTALKEVETCIDKAEKEQDLLRLINISFAKKNVLHAYEPIIAAGKSATTLHYIKNNQKISSGNAVLFDVGAEYNGYAADISRTYVKGHNKRAEDVILAVKSIQTELINQIKPDVSWRDLSMLALELTAKQLTSLKVITNTNDAQKYFPHAFGHFLGLDVHDVGDYTKQLAENMVLTVEPGIYITEEGLGVRLEDDILVTKTGAKVL